MGMIEERKEELKPFWAGFSEKKLAFYSVDISERRYVLLHTLNAPDTVFVCDFDFGFAYLIERVSEGISKCFAIREFGAVGSV